MYIRSKKKEKFYEQINQEDLKIRFFIIVGGRILPQKFTRTFLEVQERASRIGGRVVVIQSVRENGIWINEVFNT